MHGAAPGLPEGSDVQPHVVGWERADVSIWEEKGQFMSFGPQVYILSSRAGSVCSKELNPSCFTATKISPAQK